MGGGKKGQGRRYDDDDAKMFDEFPTPSLQIPCWEGFLLQKFQKQNQIRRRKKREFKTQQDHQQCEHHQQHKNFLTYSDKNAEDNHSRSCQDTKAQEEMKNKIFKAPKIKRKIKK